MKILTVDDSRTIRLLVRKYLEPEGFEVLEAVNGQEGVQAAARHKPDLILLDVTMPVLSGEQALEVIRKDPVTSEIPVLMLTAESRKDLVISLIQLGISDYVLKPFDRDTIVEKVHKTLASRRRERDEGVVGSASDEDSTGLPVVLVLDDKENVLQTARRCLAGVAEVITTKEPFEALELANQRMPRIVLMDLVIPGTNVFEVFCMMRTADPLKSTRFVALAIRTMRDEVARARNAGFHDVLAKPFDQESITRLVRRNLSGSATLVVYGDDHATIRFPGLVENPAGSGAPVKQVMSAIEAALNELADGGYSSLILDMSEAAQTTEMWVVSTVSKIQQSGANLGLQLKILVPNGPLARTLRHFSETCQTTLYNTLEEALQPPVEEHTV